MILRPKARLPLRVCKQTPAGQQKRWHQTLKNRVLLENYLETGDLKGQIGQLISHYNPLRYHESLQNLTPADVYFQRVQSILEQRASQRLEQSPADQWNGSSKTQSTNGACNTANAPYSISQWMSQALAQSKLLSDPKIRTTDSQPIYAF